jgi:hypothetical protein
MSRLTSLETQSWGDQSTLKMVAQLQCGRIQHKNGDLNYLFCHLINLFDLITRADRHLLIATVLAGKYTRFPAAISNSSLLLR